MYSPSVSLAADEASEAPPYASTSTTGRRKRTAADVDYAALDAPEDEDTALDAGGNAQQRLTKRRAPRSTAAEKQARKVARMERNRSAYRASCRL